MQHHIEDKLCSYRRCDQGIKWMCGTEGIPKAEGAVVGLSLGHLLDLKVGVHVATIHITHGVRLHQHVIEASVEDGLLFIGTLNVDAAQLLLPSIVGGLNIVVEVPALGFGLHILASAFVIDRRDGNFHH